ncbi:hypothetical protein BME24068_04721 [Burkholderia metallica]|nr:hypothetical protein BME24068_04721 [Burkholderia metallica]
MARRDGAKTTGYFGMAPPLAQTRSGQTRDGMRRLRKESRHFARAPICASPRCRPHRIAGRPPAAMNGRRAGAVPRHATTRRCTAAATCAAHTAHAVAPG